MVSKFYIVTHKTYNIVLNNSQWSVHLLFVCVVELLPRILRTVARSSAFTAWIKSTSFPMTIALRRGVTRLSREPCVDDYSNEIRTRYRVPRQLSYPTQQNSREFCTLPPLNKCTDALHTTHISFCLSVSLCFCILSVSLFVCVCICLRLSVCLSLSPLSCSLPNRLQSSSDNSLLSNFVLRESSITFISS